MNLRERGRGEKVMRIQTKKRVWCCQVGLHQEMTLNEMYSNREPRGHSYITHLPHIGSSFRTMGFPTTMSRALARVVATLNLCEEEMSEYMNLHISQFTHAFKYRYVNV